MPKSWKDYLEENENDATRAGEAASRDVAAREGENQSARAFRRAFEPPLKELGIALTQDGASQLVQLVDTGRDTSNRVPQGGLALTAEQAQQWTAWQQVKGPDGKPVTPEQASTALTRSAELETANQLRDTVGEDASMPVLQDRLRGTNLTVERRDRTENGQPVKDQRGNVVRELRIVETVNGQATDRGPLKDYAQQHWAPYVPALFPTGGQQQTQQHAGTVVTGQSGGGSNQDQGGNVIASSLGRSGTDQGQRTVVGALDFKKT